MLIKILIKCSEKKNPPFKGTADRDFLVKTETGEKGIHYFLTVVRKQVLRVHYVYASLMCGEFF